MNCTITVYDPVESSPHFDQSITIECKVTFETKPFFSKSFGNWLPGDPGEVEILKATYGDRTEVPETIIEEIGIERIEEEAYARAVEESEPPED